MVYLVYFNIVYQEKNEKYSMFFEIVHANSQPPEWLGMLSVDFGVCRISQKRKEVFDLRMLLSEHLGVLWLWRQIRERALELFESTIQCARIIFVETGCYNINVAVKEICF